MSLSLSPEQVAILFLIVVILVLIYTILSSLSLIILCASRISFPTSAFLSLSFLILNSYSAIYESIDLDYPINNDNLSSTWRYFLLIYAIYL